MADGVLGLRDVERLSVTARSFAATCTSRRRRAPARPPDSHAVRPPAVSRRLDGGQGRRARLRASSCRTCAAGTTRPARSIPTSTKATTATTRSSGLPRSRGRTAASRPPGLSYPGAVQWLAAVETPPHLVCAFPAMCFSSARQFFYFGGAFDLSWLPWTANNIAPDDRRRRNVSGPQTGRDARAWWREHGRDALRRVPLRGHPLLAGRHAVLRRVARPSRRRALLGLRGAGAAVRERAGAGLQLQRLARRRLRAGRRDAQLRRSARQRRHARGACSRGSSSARGCTASRRPRRGRWATATSARRPDSTTTRWCSTGATCTRVASIAGCSPQPPVRLFVMGANRWRTESTWPVPSTPRTLYLRAGGGADVGAASRRRGARALRVRPERPGRGPALRRRPWPARPARHRIAPGRAGVLDAAARRGPRGRRVRSSSGSGWPARRPTRTSTAGCSTWIATARCGT